MTAKDMLAVVLRRGVLTERERESFTDMWDRIHRFNRCSDKQRAWIEKVYFGQKLDREEDPAKRRVVVPTWKKGKHGSAPVPTQQHAPVATRTEGALGPGLVKTNAREIMRRRQSGTFAIPTRQAQKAAAAQEAAQIGYINYPGVQRETLVTSLLALETICPRISPESKQYKTIAKFFERGGLVLKVKPLEAQVA